MARPSSIFLGETDGFLHCRHVNFKTGYHMGGFTLP